MDYKFRNKKGITLIALVVTIIILLIISGITLYTLRGNNILNRAGQAKNNTQIAQIDEQVKMSVLEAVTDGLGTIKSTTSLDNALKNNVEKEYHIEENGTKSWIITLIEDKLSYMVNGNGEITEIEYEEPIDNSGSLVLGLVDDLGTSSTIYLYGNSDKITSGNITITMPDGSTKNITAVEDNTNITNSSNYATYTVTKNGTYTFSAQNGATTTETTIKVKNIERFKKVDNLGLSYVNSENKAYNYKGASVPKEFYVDTKSNVDTGLVLTDSVGSEGYSTGNEWVWVPVNSTVGNDDYYITESGNLAGATSVLYTKYSKLYSFSQAKTRDAYGTFYPNGNSSTDTLGKPSETGGFREPSLLIHSDYGESKYYSSINKRGTGAPFTDAEGITAVAIQYKTDYENMIESVNKYGGFYIGRYEITGSVGSPTEKVGNPITDQTWYTLYNQCMSFDKYNDNITSGMIYGTLWDATMQWLAKSEYNVGYTGNDTSGYGNYNTEAVTVGDDSVTITVKASGTSTKLKTGQTSYTRSNNIYDLSGNYYDWTQEACYSNSRISRRRLLHLY